MYDAKSEICGTMPNPSSLFSSVKNNKNNSNSSIIPSIYIIRVGKLRLNECNLDLETIKIF